MYTLANSYLALGRYDDALQLHERTLALQKDRIGHGHRNTLLSMAGLANSYDGLGRYADALKLREKTLALQIANLGPDHPETLMSMWGLAKSLVRLDRGAEAMPLIVDCLKRAAGEGIDPHLVPGLMDLRLRYFEKLKDAAGCRATAAMWENLKRTDPDSLYVAACFRAVTAAVIKAGNDRSAEVTRIAREEADLAMSWLKQCLAAGYNEVARMKQDKDLEILRERDDFKRLLTELEQKQKEARMRG
jgi:tetratricopeptide (TPR) repeat protein